jgi:hypothetical protein
LNREKALLLIEVKRPIAEDKSDHLQKEIRVKSDLTTHDNTLFFPLNYNITGIENSIS